MSTLLTVVISLAALALGFAVGFLAFRSLTERKQSEARSDANSIREEAESEASRITESARREAELAAKEESLKIKAEAEEEARTRRTELARYEERLESRDNAIGNREKELDNRKKNLDRREESLDGRAQELESYEAEQRRKLEEISGLSHSDAEARVVAQVESEIEGKVGRMIRERVQEAEHTAEMEAKHILSTTMERLASDHTSESTVKAVALSSDDMKGRVIGKEGRNIRAFEAATGVDVIIDDTPETVVLSCFDSVRREVARVAMERLVTDGRIHPGRIEQVVAKAKKDIDKEIKNAGRQALDDAKISGGMDNDLVSLLGALKYRTSYGQNVLAHSVEVANLCGMMGAELGVDVKVCRRAGLLHDAGKAVDHEVEGTHAMIGGRYARKAGETEEVVRAISAHHHEIEMESVEDVLVATADAVSAGRPGARRETTEIYIERLRSLESIATNHDGVEKAYAIQAGREVRVMVRPQQIDDNASAKLALEISKQIENDLEYPGQIRVTVIRESRVSEVAR